MEPIARLIRRAGYWLGARRHAEDLAAELEDHRARLQAALEADGMAPAEAAVRSRRAMGNVTLAREDARHVWIAAAFERIAADVRYGLRALRREPSFAATALLTLTLGIFTTTTVFTVVDAELWRPLPFPEARQLVAVHAYPPERQDSEWVSAAELADWRTMSRLADYAGEGAYGRRVLQRGVAESVRVQAVTANYFQLLQHAPRIGRAFNPETDTHAKVAILSDRGWQRLFDRDPGVLGTVLTLDGTPYTVVGINGGQHIDLNAVPDLYVVADPGTPGDRAARTLTVLGRVRPGATMAQAEAELRVILGRLAEISPQDHKGHRVEFEDLRRAYRGYNWRPLFFFLAVAAVVLLLSCLNVANLLLARALRRQREFAIRGALGGGRAALTRQLLVEGALLALPSAAAATLFTAWALRAFATQIPEEYLQQTGPIGPDARITLFVVAIAAVTTIALALTPMFFARRINLNVMLGQGARTGASRRHVRARSGLLVAQLTLTLVLTTGAGLFVRSFAGLLDVPLGFDPADRLTVRVALSGERYAGDPPVRAFAEQLIERARAIPGVQDVAVDSTSPLDSGPIVRVAAADRARPAAGSEPTALMRAVSADFFRTLAMTPKAGRGFTATDIHGAPRVAIINEYLAGRLFPGESAVGKQMELVPGARVPWTRRPGLVEIVGVIANAKDVSIHEVEFGNVYVPFAQAPAPGIELIARSAMPTAQLTDALRRAVADVDPALPVVRVQTMTDRVALALSGERFNVVLIGAFACVALVLAAVGIYGAMACAVQERTREFGVRLALGQQPRALLRATVWESMRFGMTGAAIGLAMVLLIARVLGNALYLVRGEHTGLLYGVTTTDPATIASAIVGLIVVATLSGLFPARDATRIDPLIALKQD
jgi:putative ABC transport system permease protein